MEPGSIICYMPKQILLVISILILRHRLHVESRNARDNKFNNNGMKVLGVPPPSSRSLKIFFRGAGVAKAEGVEMCKGVGGLRAAEKVSACVKIS